MSERNRIIIGACCFADALPAIRVGADLAAHTGAEILAILAEDDAIRQAAALPFVKALTRTAREAEALTPEAMQHAYLRDARVMRNALANATRQAEIRWSFQHRQGRILRLMRDAAGSGDLLLIGHERAPRHAGEIVLLDQSDPVEPRLLDLARHLAQTTGRTLRLFIPPASARKLQDALPSGTAIENAADQTRFLSYLRHQRPVALLIAASASDRIDIEATANLARCPVVVALDRAKA